jgi:predicted DNA-binding transcriptional regulator YafY
VLLETDLQTARRHLMDAIGLFEQRENGVLLHNQSDDLGWFARELASLPFGFKVISPPALLDELSTIGARLSKIASVR